MFIFCFLSIIISVYIPLYKKKVYLIQLTWVSLSFVIVVSNFEHIRYSVSYDKKGNKYTYDRFTGKKWKNLSKYPKK